MAKSNVSVDLSALENDLIKYFHKTLSHTAGIIADELTETAAFSIDAFYKDYSPRYYHRHYYNFENRSFRRYYSNPHGKNYSGGVEFTPDMMDDIYKDPVGEVFDMVYAGFHGVSSGYENPNTFTVTPVMKPSPMEIILRKRDEIVKDINKYVQKGQEAAAKEKYAVINVR